MNRAAVISRCVSRGYATAAPKTSTGIEHADTMKKQAGGNPNWKDYKVEEYLKMNKYSYYDVEVDIAKLRVPQPSSRKPDVMPKIKG